VQLLWRPDDNTVWHIPHFSAVRDFDVVSRLWQSFLPRNVCAVIETCRVPQILILEPFILEQVLRTICNATPQLLRRGKGSTETRALSCFVKDWLSQSTPTDGQLNVRFQSIVLSLRPMSAAST
jgi:hypothetical protein